MRSSYLYFRIFGRKGNTRELIKDNVIGGLLKLSCKLPSLECPEQIKGKVISRVINRDRKREIAEAKIPDNPEKLAPQVARRPVARGCPTAVKPRQLVRFPSHGDWHRRSAICGPRSGVDYPAGKQCKEKRLISAAVVRRANVDVPDHSRRRASHFLVRFQAALGLMHVWCKTLIYLR